MRGRAAVALAAMLAAQLAQPVLAQPVVSQPPVAAPPAAGTPAYQPTDADERGLWMAVDEQERKLRGSQFLVRDPALNDYVRSVLCRVVGDGCRDIRLYIVRTPQMNATMAPNGMMVVWTGLLLRVRDEAQLAAVLAHEYGHYRDRHSVRLFRDAKAKTNAIGFLAVVPGVNLAVSGIALAAQVGIAGSLFAFSREMERSADEVSVDLLARSGFDPHAASHIWAQVRSEQDATAAARGTKSRKDRDGGMFASHPPTAERMADLAALAARQQVSGTPAVHAERYRAALAPHWAMLIDDQIKLNDFGGTEFLLNQLAATGWTADLLYARAELLRSRGTPEDLVRATEYYAAATAAADAPAEAWRGHGLALLRSGRTAEGQALLKTYLSKAPGASDRAMIAMLAGVSQ